LLQELIRPHSLQEFFTNFWEKAPLHIRSVNDPDAKGGICELVSIDDIDALLAAYGAGMHRLEGVRMGQSGILVPPQEYTRNCESSFGEIDVERVLSLYRRGASIILNQVDDTIGPLRHLCQSLSQAFRTSVHANAYLTPPHSQGFPVHFDTHDVFVLQLAGEKLWDLYEPEKVLATMRFAEEANRRPEGTARQVRLTAGDVLYVPRGHPHEARAHAHASLHITLGLTAYTWSDAIRDVLYELEVNDEAFRHAFGSTFEVDGAEPRTAMLTKLTAKLCKPELFEAAWQRKAKQPEARQNFRGRLGQLFVSPHITHTTKLRACPHHDLQVKDAGNEVVVSFGPNSLTLPSFTMPQVRALLDGTATSAAKIPPGLDDDGKLVLVRRLVDEGLLMVEW
jgi:ribosomal protein L16 Arg81 hydroxylase